MTDEAVIEPIEAPTEAPLEAPTEEPIISEDPSVDEVTEDGLSETVEDHPSEDGEKVEEKEFPEYSEQLEGISYGEESIDVTMSEDVHNLLVGAGIDPVELTKELYADGEISLNEHRMEELYQAFGKTTVDVYLQSAKQAMELNAFKAQQIQSEYDAGVAERWEDALEVVGSEDNWTSMEGWLASDASLDLVSENELKEFNDVMETGSPYMQKLAINALYSKYTSTLPKGEEQKLNLIEGDASSSNFEADYLTADQYLQLFSSGKMSQSSPEEKAKYDAMRRKGQSLGL